MTNEALAGKAEDRMPTHEIMAWLPDQERDRFVKLQETFETAGWKLIEEYALAKVSHHGVAGANASTWEESRKNLGARLAWDEVTRMADEFMTAFENAAQAARESSEEAVEDVH